MKKSLPLTIVLLLLAHYGRGQSCGNLDPCNSAACGSAFVTYSPVGDNVFCEGSVITLNNTSNTADFEIFYIDWGDGQADTIDSYDPVTHTYDYSGIDRCAEGPSFTQSICYIGSKTCANGVSCNTSVTFITVLLRPVAQFELPSEACVDTPVEFSETSCNVDDDDSYLWNFGDGTTSTLRNPTHIYTTPGFYTVSLTVTNDCGSDTQSRSLQIANPPEAAFDYDPAFSCEPTIFSFTDQSDQWSGIFWEITPNNPNLWQFTDTVMNTGSPYIEIAVFQPGEYTITQIAFNACGEDTETVTVNIYEEAIISIQAPPVSCEQVSLSSADLSFAYTGDIFEFNWTFVNGNPATATGPNFSGVVFTQSGTATLEIIGPCGNQSMSVPIAVASAEPITIGSNPATLCNNAAPVTLQASPATGGWSGPGVTPDGELDPAGLAPGTYTYTFSLGINECSNPESIDIEILAAPAAAIAPVAPACDSLSYTPQVTYGGEIVSYSWSFPGGLPASSNEPNPSSIQYNAAGTYLAVVAAASAACGTAFDTVEIVVQANVALQIAPPPGIICSGSSPFALTANAPGGTWTGNGITDAAAGLFDPAAVVPGEPNLIEYTLNNGPCSASADITLTVTASASVDFPADTFCIDSPPRILSIAPAGGTFSGPGVNSATGLFDPAAAGAGAIPIQYDYVDANNCAVSAVASILVEGLPQLNLPDTSFLCLSDISISLPAAIGFSAQPGGGTAAWSGPGITSPQGDFSAEGLSEGIYQLTVEYERNDCQVQRSFFVQIAPPPPLAVSPDASVCISEQFFQLQANLPGEWSGPGIDADGRIDLQAAGGNVVHTYRFEHAAGTNCEQVATIEVEIIDLGALIDAGPDVALCAGPATYTLGGASPPQGYWVGAGLLDPLAGTIGLDALVPDSTYVFQYCIESQSASSCEACDSRTFILHTNPAAAFALDGTACIDEVFGVQNNSTGADQYRWDFGDGAPPTDLPEPTYQYTEPGSYAIELIAINTATACRDTAVLNLFVTTPPVAAFSLAEDEGCAPFPLVIQDGSSGFEIQRAWYVAGDTIYGAPPAGVLLDGITQDSTFIIRLEVSNLCGERAAEAEVLVYPYPIVRFGLFPNEGCSPLEVGLANVTLGNPETFLWDLGNGTSSTDSLPTLPVYTTSDTDISVYAITLIAANACGVDTLTREVTVFPPDVRAFLEADVLRGCSPLTVNLESYSTPGSDLTWLILSPDGTQQGSNLNQPQFTLEAPGQHTVILMASKCGMDADTAYIEVLPQPSGDILFDTLACPGAPVHFSIVGNAVGQVLHYGTGDSTMLNNSQYVYPEAGTYLLRLALLSELGCPASLERALEVLPRPIAQASVSDSVCVNEPVFFVSSSNGTQSCQWQFGDGQIGDQCATRHAYAASGSYMARLIAISPLGCRDTAAVPVYVRTSPRASFAFEVSPACSPTPVSFLNTSQQATSFQWDLGDGNTSTLINLEHVYQSGNAIPVTLIAGHEGICFDTLTQMLTIRGTPQFDTAVIDQRCLPTEPWVLEIRPVQDDVIDNVIVTGEGFYQDDFIDRIELIGSGDFILTLVAANGCESSLPFYVPPIDPLVIRTIPDTSILLGQSVRLSTQVNAADLDILWTPDLQLDAPTALSPLASPFRTTTYIVQTERAGCLASDTVTIQVNAEARIFFPNAFSPNGDGINDEYRIFSGPGIEKINTFKIFSRWGSLLFEQDDLEPNDPDPSRYWNGKFRGYYLDPGVFTYFAEVEFVDGETAIFTGGIHLVR